MILKKLPQAGHFAWSNSKKNSYLFATGTLRTQDDTLLNLDQENFLQIFNLDTGDKTDHLSKSSFPFKIFMLCLFIP